MLTPPKGFESRESRKLAGSYAMRLVQAWQSEEDRCRKFERYQIAQDVIDDKIIFTKLSIVTEVEPWQADLVAQRVEGVVSDVCGGYTGQNPYFVAKGQDQEDEQTKDLREAREHDTQLYLTKDLFPLKVRDIGRTACVWCRGPFLSEYQTRYYGEEFGNPSKEIRFSGPVRTPIKPKEFLAWPSDEPDLNRCVLVGNVFRMSRAEMMALQLEEEDGFFDDVEIPVAHDGTDGRNSENSDTDRPLAYRLIVKLRPGSKMFRDPAIPAQDLEDADARQVKAYRMVVLADSEEPLMMEEYDLEECEYFAPAMRRDVGEIYAEHSVATRGLASQLIYNDALTAEILAVVAAIKRPVLAGGFVTDMETMDLGLGSLVGFKGKPEFYSPPMPGVNGQAMESIADRAERIADGAMGQSQVGSGQLPDANQTATATAGALAGQSKRSEEYGEEFNTEMARAIAFEQRLVARNWRDFKKFHGANLRTQRASDWLPRFEFAANGQGPSNNPQLTLQKIDTMVDAFQKLGVQFREDVDEMAPQVVASRVELAQGVVDNLDFPSGMENVIEIVEPAPPEPAGTLGEGAAGPGIPGLDALPPELLASLGIGGIPPGLPAPIPGGPLGGAPMALPTVPPIVPGPGGYPLDGGMPLAGGIPLG